MRWAYVCGDPGVPVFGSKGCSIHVQELIRALRRRDVEVMLFARRLGGSPPSDLDDVPIHLLPEPRAASPAERERELMALDRHTWVALRQHGPFDAVYERYSLWNVAATDYAQHTGIPGLVEVNAPLVLEQRVHRQLTDSEGALAASLRTWRQADQLIAVSCRLEDYLRTYVHEGTRIRVIGNGVDPSRFRTAQPSDRVDHLTVGFVGTLRPWHGLGVLGQAFSLLHQVESSWRLLIVGGGPAQSELTASLSRLAREAVTFTGPCGAAEVPGYLAHMDLAVAPYPAQLDFYFSPLKILEYQAAHLPVVASNVGDIPMWVHHEHTGYLVPPGDASELARALQVLGRDPGLRRRLGAAARDHAMRHHTWDQVALATIECFQEVAGREITMRRRA